jgi:kynureninase
MHRKFDKTTTYERRDAITYPAIRRWDQEDPLRHRREEFELPGGLIYMDGNSLGPLPRATRARIEEVVTKEWGQGLIRSWNDHNWIDAPLRVGDKIAKLIGARGGEVVVADSTSVNLYKLLGAALAARPDRCVVLSEPGNFPTDLYMAEGAIGTRTCSLQLRLEPAERIIDAIDSNTAVVMLTHVHYKTAAVHDMRAITAKAHEHGALVIWDLSHSVGAIEVDLNGCEADMAVGCGYKYLNGGPGAPAFLFVAERLQGELASPLRGWMGHNRPFEFVDQYEPATGIRRFLCGTPSILGVLSLEVGVDLILRSRMQDIVQKSRWLSDLFVDLLADICPSLKLVSPANVLERGSHVSFAHPEGYAIMQALIERGVIGDFRAPDLLRFGFTPLYLRYQDVWDAAHTITDVIHSGCWADPRYAVRAAVT